MKTMKTKTWLAVLFVAAVSLVSCKQNDADMIVTDLKIADTNIPGTYASQEVDAEAMAMTVYEYVLNEDGTGTYTVVASGNGVANASATVDFKWVRGELTKDLLSIPITLTTSGETREVLWKNGSIIDGEIVCDEAAKATNYGKILSTLPNTSWAAADTTWFINMLQLDSMRYQWKNQRDTLTQLEIAAENLTLQLMADEIRKAMGLADTATVQVTVLKDLGNGEFQVIYPHYVGTKVHYEKPDTIGVNTAMSSTLMFSRSMNMNPGMYLYDYASYKLNADSTDVELVKSQSDALVFTWYILSLTNAKKFYVEAVASDTIVDMLISGFDKTKGTLEYNGISYKISK